MNMKDKMNNLIQFHNKEVNKNHYNNNNDKYNNYNKYK